jgi:hypothetical protein
MSADLDQHIRDLIATAKRRKANAKERLAVMKGDEVRFPSRGPIQYNGRACIRWHFWHGARERHQKLGRLIKELIALRRRIGEEDG